MLLLSAVCALIAALLVLLAGLWHRRAQPMSGLAQEKALYAGFVADVDRRLERGDIDTAQAAEERAEAGRALLKAGETAEASAIDIKPVWLAVAVAVGAAATFGLYLFVGHPRLPDQPYAGRVKAWASAANLPSCLPAADYETRWQGWLERVRADPSRLPGPAALAAVLRHDATTCGGIADYWNHLGGADQAAGDYHAAIADYETARSIAPSAFTRWTALGEARTFFAKGDGDPEARRDFEMALTQDPGDAAAHYFLGRQALQAGQYDDARAQFRASLALKADNADWAGEVNAELRMVDDRQAADQAATARISAMVAQLASQLKANPDNADGWARLLRSYDVLGDKAGHDQAVTEIKAHFTADQAAGILAKSQAAVGAEDTGAMP